MPASPGRVVYECREHDSVHKVESLTGMLPDQLSMEFESLGDNCELGLVQRGLGAEPLGLLRFSFVYLAQAFRGIDTNFDRVGSRLRAIVEGKENEWMVRDPDYDLRWHTFLLSNQATHEEIMARETKKTAFLHQKLLKDIASSEKIFVVKSRERPAELEQIMALHLALNRTAPNYLLWATAADQSHPVGFVEEIAPRLLHGRIASSDKDIPGWLALLTNAWLCARQRAADLPHVQVSIVPDDPAPTTEAAPALHVDPPSSTRHVEELMGAVQGSPSDAAVFFRCIAALRAAHRLDEVDALYAAAPPDIRRNVDIISVWAAIPRIRADWPETLRRARLMLELHPDHSKPHHHLIYAINGTSGYDAGRLYARWAMDRFGEIPTFTAPALEIASQASDYAAALYYLVKLRGAGQDSAWVRRMWVLTLGNLRLREEQHAALNRAKADFPGNPDISGIEPIRAT
jgi:hypothetical protein